MISCKIIWN